MEVKTKNYRIEREMEGYLVEKVRTILGESSRTLSKDKNLMDIGVDSSNMVLLSKSIEEDLGIRLMPTIFFEYQNIKELAAYFTSDRKESLEGFLDTRKKLASAVETNAPGIMKNEIQSAEIEEEEGLPPLPELMDYGSCARTWSETDEDIAIIGMSGMFGGSKGLDTFWNNLLEGRNLITEIPTNHFDFRPWYDAESKTPDKIYCKWGSFMDDIDKFDASFFNISPKEAEIMDPQLRLLLQVIYATAEDAGYGNKIRGSKTGMYVGNCFHDYELELTRHMDTISPYFGIGNALTMLANRPSYYLDLRGPSLSVDTACSASLVALHIACKALKAGECEMAFVAGANLLLSPTHYRYFSTIEALSHTGRCHTFDHKADGYIPGESVSAILIKPFKKALADGDRIHAVIKGSAVNHGGYTPAVTAPSVLREAQVVVDAWADAKIDPRTIRYIEAHGTGTKLGDPIEINALKHAFGKYSEEGSFCAIGSAKAHVGHAEGAAGIVGIIKLILSMKNKKIPAMPQFEKINPYIELEGSPLYINRQMEEWKKVNGIPRRGGVSAFGIGGAYAHVVLEEYDEETSSVAEEDASIYVVVLSAKDEERLKEHAQNLMEHIGRKHPEAPLTAMDMKKLFMRILADIRAFVADMLAVPEEKIDPDCDARFYGLDYTRMPVLADMINQKFDLYIMPVEMASLNTLNDIAESLVENYSHILLIIYEGSQKEEVANTITANPHLSLAKIAYTLQTGREHMEERLAVVVSSLEELYDRLKEYLSGRMNSEEIFTGSLGNAKNRNEVLLEAFRANEGQDFLYTLISDKKMNILSRLWVSGVSIDWESLYRNKKPGIVSLPTYPFAKERYWAECLEENKGKGWLLSAVAVSNAMEQRVVLPESTVDINRLRIEKSEVKDKIFNIWRQFLGVKNLSVTDDYVELGGNSIITTQIINSLRNTFGVEISFIKFLEAGNIEALTGIIEEEVSKRTAEEPVLVAEVIPLTIQPRNTHGPVPLSSDQERLWFMHHMYPSNTSHNIPAAYKIKSEIHVETLRKAINETVQRHQSLRTTFGQTHGKPVQLIRESVEISFDLVDFEKLPVSEREETAQARVLKMAALSFDLEKGPLVRFGLIRLDGETNLLYAVIHHIIADIWSIGILLQEILKTYEAFVEGKSSPVPLPQVHYPDYVVWQQERQAETLKKQIAYWEEKLSGAPELTSIPLDRPRPAMQSFKAAQFEFQVPEQVLAQIHNLCQQNRSSLYIVLLAAFKAMLGRVIGQEDIAVGSPVANRSYVETRNMVGFLANTLVLRTQMDNDSSFNELIDRVKEVVYGAFDHQEVTFSQIVEAVKPKRAANYNPLFQVMFNHVVIPDGFKDIKLEVFPVDLKTTALDFDIMLRMEERQGKLLGFFDYNPDLFEEATVRSMVEAFQGILEQVSGDEVVKLSMLKLPQLLEDKKQMAVQKEFKQKIVLSSTFTDQPVKDILEFWSEKLELPAEVQFAPYNQVYQQLLDPTSMLRKNHSGVNIVCLRFEDWLRYDSPADENEGKEKIHDNIKEMSHALIEAASNTKVPLLAVLCPSNSKYHYPEFIGGFKEAVGMISNLHIIVPDEIEDKYPVAEVFDSQADKIGHVPFTHEYFAALGTAIFRKIYTLERPPYKVVVLDCDNTLWTGACGEVGPKGVETGPGKLKFQEQLVKLKESGLLLALCSKNSEEDVMKVFKQKKRMPLKLEDVVARKINWLPKSQNIRELAKELNLGLDSFIFMDDNPMECAEVSANCPGVLTVQVPQDDHELEDLLKHLWACDVTRVTEEDKLRTEMYRQNVQREQALIASNGFGDFLKSLSLQVDIAPVGVEDLSRIEQLLQRTNQFNTTTRRHSAEHIRKLIHTGIHECMTVKVKDRFGDYGLVGVMSYEKMEKSLEVDSFLLSCRVLGKGVEHEMVKTLGKRALTLELEYVSIAFAESPKNMPAKEFLQGIEGHVTEEGTKGTFQYTLTAKKASELSFNPSKEGASKTGPEVGANHLKKSVIRAESEVITQMYRNYPTAGNIRQAVDESLKRKNVTKGEVNLTQSQPLGEMEKMVADIFKAVLHRENISITSNFFDIGGTSLLLVELSSRLKSLTNKELTIIDLFQYPTVQSLAAYLGGSKKNLFEKSKKRGQQQRQALSQLMGA